MVLVLKVEGEVRPLEDPDQVGQAEDQDGGQDAERRDRCRVHARLDLKSEGGLEARILADALAEEPIVDGAQYDDSLRYEVDPKEHEGEKEVREQVRSLVDVRLGWILSRVV